MDSGSAGHLVADPAALGRRVRELRQRRGLKQSELARGELSTAYVSRIESGQRRPERRVIDLLAERLGTTSDYLITGVGRDEAADARLTLRYAELSLHSGEAEEAVRLLRPLIADASAALGAMRPEADLLLARALEAVGSLDEAIHVLERLRQSETAPNPLEVAISLSRCYRETGDLARSIDVAEAGLRLAEELGLSATDDAVKLTVTVAAAYFERGDTAHAYHLCQTAIERSEAAASPPARAAAFWNASVIASERGQMPAAIGLAERALAMLGESTDERNLARLRLALGLMLLRAVPPDLAAADSVLRQARGALAEAGSGGADVARCDGALALVRLLEGDLDEAERIAAAARMTLGETAQLVAAQLDIVLGRVAWARGERDGSLAYYRSAVGLMTGHAADRSAAGVWYELGALLDEAGDVGAARDAYRSAGASMGLLTEGSAAPVNA